VTSRWGDAAGPRRRPCSCFFLNSNIAAESSAEAGDDLGDFCEPNDLGEYCTIYLHLSKIRVRCNALIFFYTVAMP
jgi:hypothetical protein